MRKRGNLIRGFDSLHPLSNNPFFRGVLSNENSVAVRLPRRLPLGSPFGSRVCGIQAVPPGTRLSLHPLSNNPFFRGVLSNENSEAVRLPRRLPTARALAGCAKAQATPRFPALGVPFTRSKSCAPQSQRLENRLWVSGIGQIPSRPRNPYFLSRSRISVRSSSDLLGAAGAAAAAASCLRRRVLIAFTRPKTQALTIMNSMTVLMKLP